MKLAGETYWWWKDGHIDCQNWLILQELHIRYAPHLEGPQFSDLIAECKEILAGMVKMLENRTVKVVDNPESELKVDDNTEPEPKVLISQNQGQKLLLSRCHSKKRFPHSL